LTDRLTHHLQKAFARVPLYDRRRHGTTFTHRDRSPGILFARAQKPRALDASHDLLTFILTPHAIFISVMCPLTESEQSSRACVVCPSSTLPSLPSTSLLILIEVEKIQNKIYVRLEKGVLYAWISQFPF